MKIALAQINPTIGDLEANANKIEENCAAAHKAGADLVIFPEMAVSGYPPRDLLDKPDFVSCNQETVENLIAKIHGPAVLLGHFEKLEGSGGKTLANSATVFRDGKILARVRKILLPTYDVFDELRYFQPGESPATVEIDGTKIGITICEDAWNFPDFFDHDVYSRNPVEELAESGVDLIVNLSSSPYRVRRWKIRQDLGRAIANKFQIPFCLVNQIGGNDDLLFDGHSFALSKDGELIAQAKGFEEDLIVVDLNNPPGNIREPSATEEGEIFLALTMGVRDYLHKCDYQKAVVGLSGGIDSSVVAVIAAEALGPENVTGISMPSPYTSTASIEDAEKLASNLGILFSQVSINDLFESYKTTLKPIFEGRKEDVTEENIQARIRGNILMAVSNKMGSMVLSTGNKSEMSMGYCTLYGDMAGGLSVISDVPKTKVYQLAHWINRNKETIPKRVIERPPTAELRPNQTDQDSLPPYEVLDPILEGYVEQHLSVEQLTAKGFDGNIVRKIAASVDNNEYKRNQAAPGLKVTGKAFGSGRRIPIAQRFRKR